MTNGKCRICNGKCDWTLHKNAEYILKYSIHKKTFNYEELKKKYVKGKKKVDEYKVIKKGLIKDFVECVKKCFEFQEEIKKNIEELKRIALNKVSYETSESFIQNFITSEENQKREGWQYRVKGYKELLNKHKLLRRIYEEKNILEDFEQFKKNALNNIDPEKLEDEDLEDIMDDKNDSWCILF